jgi:mono/diheme cytochrome c family protein
MRKSFVLLHATLLMAFTQVSAADINGFAVKFTTGDGKSADIMVLPNLWLFVESAKPATPFLPPGQFTAEFNGFVSAELRGNYIFIAEELGGAVKLEINGAVALDASAPGAISKPVRLNKGANAVKATFNSPANGDAFLRIGWTEKGTNANPIPNALITHASSPELTKAGTLHLGRELFLEHRCGKCHVEKFASPVPELAMDAPSFDAIGARRGASWMAKWILDPKSNRHNASMPALLQGTMAKDAAAMAAYLSSLTASTNQRVMAAIGDLADTQRKAIDEIAKRSGPNAKPTLGEGEEAAQPGERKPIFERLHCTGCHNAPDEAKQDAAKIALKHVAQKFEKEPGLRAFLNSPEQHFTWTRMPNFKLADSETDELAAFLFKHADKIEAFGPSEESVKTRGKELVQSLGCLNCHAATGLENKFAAKGLAKIAKEAKGCLADKHDEKSKSPNFQFEPRDRAALLAFIQTDFASLSRHSPIAFAQRETRLLQCNACHGQVDLVPPLEVLGGKLKPEWTANFLMGRPAKLRADIHPKGGVWVDARMPSFISRAELLAQGMAQEHGYAPKTRREDAIDKDAAAIGHKLMGKNNGLSCISCHAINDMPALEVFESEGTNLGLTGSRLLKPYFFRWMRNPLAVDPQTKMPAFFGEDGRSALTDYYEGDGEKQINALYQYIRLAEKMPKPATAAE